MIGLNERSVLTDALTPPAGFEFDSGFVATYSLDLVTLLGVPLHLAWLAHARSPTDALEPLAVIEAMRRVAGKLTVFCQSACIQVPRAASPLLGLVEPMVREVVPPHGGVFHPKVWVLKFTNAQTSESKLTLLVSSRNLTEDGSWDSCLRLDGIPGKKPTKSNRPLKELLNHAVLNAVKPLPEKREAQVKTLMDDVACCAWDLPGDFEAVAFHLLGGNAKKSAWLPTHAEGPWDSLGVVSPFVGAEALRRLAGTAKQTLFVVSRDEALQNIAALPPGFGYKTLREQAITSDLENEEVGSDRGLHAKLYAARKAWNTHLFVGSANATEAALVVGKNTEFMAELIGRASKVGKPEDLIGADAMGPLLQDFERVDDPIPKQPEVIALLESARESLAGAGLHIDCELRAGEWSLKLSGLDRVNYAGAVAHAWPVTIHTDRAVALQPVAEGRVSINGLAAQEITSLTAFRLELQGEELCFALDLPMAGAPDNRDLEILKSALRNRESFVRYLLLLLGDWELFGGGGASARWKKKPTGASASDPVPLFEMLARALAHEPDRLQQVQQVVERLREQGDDASVIPPEFGTVWASFEQVIGEDRT